MIDAKNLLAYNKEVRHRYFDALCKLPWEEFTKNREASFHSLRNIFIHTLSAIDYWLDFLQNQKLYSRREFDEYKTHALVRAYMEHIEERMQTYLESLMPEKLEKTYAAQNDDGKTVEVTAEDVLVHVFEEEVHHRGELIALLWQMNVKPPLMSWKGL